MEKIFCEYWSECSFKFLFCVILYFKVLYYKKNGIIFFCNSQRYVYLQLLTKKNEL